MYICNKNTHPICTLCLFPAFLRQMAKELTLFREHCYFSRIRVSCSFIEDRFSSTSGSTRKVASGGHESVFKHS